MAADVFLVLAELGRQSEEAALTLLIPTVQRVFPGAALHTVVSDNAASCDAECDIAENVEYTHGDNSLREFSAWDRGIDRIERRFAPSPQSVFVLANDTVVRADKRERICGIPIGRAAAADHGALVGWVDEYPQTVELFGLSVRQWVDTSFLVSSRNTLDRLRPFATDIVHKNVFADGWTCFFRQPSPLSENYRRYLSSYFFGERPTADFPHGWHAQEPLTAVNAEAFKAKMRSVFCEHLIGARARRARIPLVDIRQTPLAMDPF